MTMPLHVTNADLEDAEIEEALELNSAEDKMLHQNECRNMRRKTVVLVSRVDKSF
jgi:predicted phosphoribosyltransferase